jgi:hypothetical protein
MGQGGLDSVVCGSRFLSAYQVANRKNGHSPAYKFPTEVCETIPEKKKGIVRNFSRRAVYDQPKKQRTKSISTTDLKALGLS